MVYITKYIYSFLLPPGLFVLLLFILFCWTFHKNKKIGGIIAGICLIVYFASIPIIGNLLLSPLEFSKPKKIDPSSDVIVIFTEGVIVSNGVTELTPETFYSLSTAVGIYKKHKIPIIISGGEVFPNTVNEAQVARQELLSSGFPSDQIKIDDKSLNTNENAANTKLLLTKYGFKHPILITSSIHMDRSIQSFKKVKVTVLPYPNGTHTNMIDFKHVEDYLPSINGIGLTADALKEFLGKLDFRK